jgi:ATP-dependent Clp protease adapter protein ClpS
MGVKSTTSSSTSTRQYQRRDPLPQRNLFWGTHNVGGDLSLSTLTSLAAVLSGPSILDRPTTTKESSVTEERRVTDKRQQHQRSDETWEVRLYNDGLNTREHVSRSLVQVTGLSEYQAYHTMMQAHHNGMAVVGQYYYEIAEMFHDALKLEGIICDIVPVE